MFFFSSVYVNACVNIDFHSTTFMYVHTSCVEYVSTQYNSHKKYHSNNNEKNAILILNLNIWLYFMVSAWIIVWSSIEHDSVMPLKYEFYSNATRELLQFDTSLFVA